MKKVFILLIGIILLFYTACYASSKNTIKPYFAAGEKSQTDVTEEQDVSGNFEYYEYGLSSNFKPERNFSLKLGFEEYRKDFLNNSQSDVDARIYKIGTGFLLLDNKEASLNANLDFLLRYKRYEDSESSEYDQFKAKGALKYKLKDIYSVDLNSGINNYEYINNSDADILKIFLKISPEIYLLDKTLELSGFCRIRWLDAEGNSKDTTETILSGTTTLNLDTPVLYKIKAKIETGKENTQDTEDREDSLRYKYTKWDVVTYHKFNKRLKTPVAILVVS